MKMKNKWLLILFTLAGSSGIVKAQQPAVMVSNRDGWHLIAETTVDFAKDRDEVKVLGNDRFSALRFMVTEAPMHMMALEIVYENGTRQNVKVDAPMEIGKQSRVIDLPGDQREIDKIIMVYHTLINRKDAKAHVQIWGLKMDNKTTANTPDVDRDHAAAMERERVAKMDRDKPTNDMDRERADRLKNERAEAQAANANTNDEAKERDAEKAREDKARMERDDQNNKPDGGIPKPVLAISDKTGWHRIAETTVSFKNEKDEVAILGSDRFAKIKFKVTEANIHLVDLNIKYEDGTLDNVALKTNFKEGEESRIIDVPGAEKDIAKISFTYHTIPNQGKDHAHVEIWGLKTNTVK